MIALDTHAAVWLGENPGRLTPAATRSIQAAVESGAGLLLSSTSLYEIARGVHRGRIESQVSIEELLRGIERRFVIAPVTADIAIIAAQLPADFPSDPFDRIIAATAIVHRIPLITADQHIRRSRAVRTLW